ncbi:hypothetical protein IV57_GL000592 [Companilactobacillus kimchiensis]|uniref:Integral membrane protein n=2 Tax=Companilactobacillus kimchiensis TaxID=993692 RepID=A0A0R2LAU6_9LACO|nr:hypothetical protein IV57_GL000592 [Companilactobacillus kimchiensis]
MIPLILMIIIFWCTGLTPFGNHNLMFGDVGTQYIAFLTYFRQQLTNFNGAFYSFSLSLGDNFFDLFSYYLLSPFNLILLLFPVNQVPKAFNVIILLKIATIGLSGAYFFQKFYQNRKLSNLLFSTVYALCGFVALYFYNLMWLDALILLPLVTLGIQQIFYQQKSNLYIFSLLLTIITNYYMGYMMCLFSVIYFLYLGLLNRQLKVQVVGRYLVSSIISGLLSLVIVLPTILAMLQSSKEKINLHNFLPIPEFGKSSLIQFGVVGNTIIKRTSPGPEVFMTSFILILLITFFLNQQINQRQKAAAGAILVILFLGMYLLTFNTVWHMFQPPVGLHFRNVYFFSFIAITLAYESFHAGIRQHDLVIAIILTILIVSVGYIFANKNRQYVSINYLYLSLGFILTTGLLMNFLEANVFFKYLLSFIVGLELVINFVGGLQGGSFGQEKFYQKYYQIESKTYQEINKNNHTFYRITNLNPLIDQTDSILDSNNNDPLFFNSRGVSLYSSTFNAKTRQMLLDLGYYGRNVRSISPNGATKLTDALFGVKYHIIGQQVRQTQALGVGTLVNKQLLKVRLKPGSPINNQEYIWQAINGNEQKYFVQPQITFIKPQELIIHGNQPGNLYFINQASVQAIVINGKKIIPDSYSDKMVIDLGDKVVNRIKIIGSVHNLKEQFFVLNNQKLSASIKHLNRQSLKVHKNFNGQRINGNIKVTSSKQILLLNIPYDKGWQVTVDGQKMPLGQTMGNLSYLQLCQGKHQIELNYQVPGLKLGSVISLGTFLTYLGFCYKHKLDR